MSENVLVARSLTKRYGGVTVVDFFSLVGENDEIK